MLSIVGQSNQSVRDFQASPRLLFWSAEMLDGSATEGPNLAIKMLMSLTTKLLRNKEEAPYNSVPTNDKVFHSWDNHLKYLWIISKNYNEPVKIAKPESTPGEFDVKVLQAW